MPVAFIADVHVGNPRILGGPVEVGLNARAAEIVHALGAAREAAVRARCTHLFVLGDLFDTDRPSPQMVAAVQDVLESPSVSVVLLLGNHEMTSTTEGDHALAPLAHVRNVTVADRVLRVDTSEGCVHLIPFQPGGARQWLPKAASTAQPGDMLATHVGIIDDKTPAWLVEARDAVPLGDLAGLAAKLKLSRVLAGNWHTRHLWCGDNIVQVGALVPTGWDNPGIDGYGSLVIVDDGDLRVEEIPGPRFCRASSGKAAAQLLSVARKRGHRLYLKVTKIEHVPAPNPDFSFVLEGTGEEAQAAAEDAATSAKAAETTDEALAAFVKEMPLDDGVDRAAVLSRCREMLK